MNPVLQILRDVGTLLLLGVALVVSSAASLVFGTAGGLGDRAAEPRSVAGRAADDLRHDPRAAAARLGHRPDHVPGGRGAEAGPALTAGRDHPRRGGHHRAADLQHPAAGQRGQEPHPGALRHHHRPADLVQPGQPGLRGLRRVGGDPGGGPQGRAGRHDHRLGCPAASSRARPRWSRRARRRPLSAAFRRRGTGRPTPK